MRISLTYDAEILPLTNIKQEEILTVELEFMRRYRQFTYKDKVRTTEIWQKMVVVQSVISRLINLSLQWIDHVKGIVETTWPKMILEWASKEPE